MTRIPSVVLAAALTALTAWLGLGAAAGGSEWSSNCQPEILAAEPLFSPVQWSGPRSEIRDPRLIQITDQESWNRLWTEHQGARAERLIAHGGGVASPRIDFERYLVIAMFRGETTNCDGERLVSLQERKDDVLLRFDSFTFQTSSFDGPDRGEAARSYGLWLVPRTGKPITIEENTQGMLDREPTWTWRTSMPAP